MKGSNISPPLLTEYNERILLLFRTVQKRLRERMTKESQLHGFTFPQMFLIRSLFKYPGINLNDLSEHMELSRSTVSGIVDRLVSQRVVIREIPEEDRRTVRLFLDPQFLDKFDILRFRKQMLAGLLKGASKEDLESIVYGFEKLLELIQDSE